ncbi:WbqC family protein [Formosa sp. S-31]|uniref:WbqC family protein n=1 Tax=Formosa sp. S-31 TaxID=2790949 RepID=UPI003EC0EB9D
MSILLHPTYFPNIAHMAAMAQSNCVLFEKEDNFSKQTFRTRTYIYAANGELLLNIPVVYSQKNRQKYKDILVSHDTKWQGIHWKSLLSAYKTSPFFEYYEDELQPLFELPVKYLLDFNLKCFDVICDCLQFYPEIDFTTEYQHELQGITDLRHLVERKSNSQFQNEPYTQVFDTKHGFKPNLSILDLLFNEGPNALHYLEQQNVKF